jgi:hypothetical protein
VSGLRAAAAARKPIAIISSKSASKQHSHNRIQLKLSAPVTTIEHKYNHIKFRLSAAALATTERNLNL